MKRLKTLQLRETSQPPKKQTASALMGAELSQIPSTTTTTTTVTVHAEEDAAGDDASMEGSPEVRYVQKISLAIRIEQLDKMLVMLPNI